jgi:hypothetical protein
MDRNRKKIPRPEPKCRPAKMLLDIGLAAALAATACSGAGRMSAGPAGGTPQRISQPVVPANLSVAPESERVDLAMPSFSDPTNITNPLFPMSEGGSNLLLGTVDGKAFRTEVTLLPDTRIIEWGGRPVETLVSQYVAYLDGRLHEVAYDFYAQADDGSVWYFGEDVFNFKDGVISDTHGSWIAGKDGPVAMIMPADPKVGDVYRPENIPGFVFEEVTVKAVGQTLRGPVGPIDGGLVVQELHMDGNLEDKTFAPGYGEFYTAGGGDTEALAMAVPTDAASGPAPAELETLSSGALDVFTTAGSEAWSAASATIERMAAAWETYRRGEVPQMVEPRMVRAFEALSRAVAARDVRRARQAAIDTAQWSLDLQLRHRPTPEIDLARFDLWLAQLTVDGVARDVAAVNGDFFTLDYIRDRIEHTLQGADRTQISAQLEALYEAVSAVQDGHDPEAASRGLAAVADAAGLLREAIAGLMP